jgi:F-type H+-transporting ATPase subunit b
VSFDLPTFLFQAINFLVLVAVLWRLLWRPLRRHMADRADRIDRGLTDLEEGRREVETMRGEAEESLRVARKKESEALAAAEREAEARRNELLEEARGEAAEERDRLLSQVGREQERREREFLRALSPALVRVVDRLLGQLGDAAQLHEITCGRFAEELGELPEDERDRIRSASDAGGDVELVTAKQSVPASLPMAVEALVPAARIQRRIDHALVGGALLRVGETVIDGSVAAQVRRALEDAA